MTARAGAAGALLTLAVALVGCAGGQHRRPDPAPLDGPAPAALVAESRPIGAGPRFQPPLRGSVTGACQTGLGPRFGVHVELFAANRVVLVAGGIGTRPPRRLDAGRITAAACYGPLVTLDPTGLLLVRRGARATLGELFRAWGQPLGPHELAGFAAPPGGAVRVYLGGRPWPGRASALALTPHAEIVLEVGPYVPPHAAYTFPPGW